jgi:hypothetical protein
MWPLMEVSIEPKTEADREELPRGAGPTISGTFPLLAAQRPS